MLKIVANAVTAISLLLSASAGAPAWSAGKANGHSANCPDAKKKLATKRPVAAPPARGVMVVEKRKLDVQILSFGP